MGKPGPAARKLAGFRREADRTHKELEVARATVAAKQEAYDKAAHDYGDRNKDFKLAKAEADRLIPSTGYFGTTDEAHRYTAAQDRKYAAQRASSEARKAMKRAEAELDAAKSVVDDKRGAAELADLELQDARDAADAEEAAAKRAGERDHPEVSAEPEVDLDADDAAAVRADATAAREAAETGYAAEATRIAKERDPAAREKWAADQELKAAEMQVKGQQKALDQARNEVGSLNREADRYAKTDPARAEHLRERARTAATDQQIAEARLEDSKRAVEAAREVAQRQAEVLKGLEDQQRDLQQKRDAAERAIDGLEERARLLEEAQRKFAEANRSGDEKLRTDAEALVQRAERVHVDDRTLGEPTEAEPLADGSGPKAGVNPEKVAFIREEIAKGNHVSIGPDGVPASIEPKTPPTPEQIQKNLEAFDRDVSSGKFEEEVAKGNSYESNPDGSGGYTQPEPSTEAEPLADGSAPKASVNPEKVAFIREEIAKGNHVSIGPDGVPASIEPKTPPTPEQIQKNLQAFDRDVSSGKFEEEVAKGNSYESNPDGSGGYTEPELPAGGEPSADEPAPPSDLTTAELREMTGKYAEAAQAVHKQRVESKLPNEDYEKNMDARLELKGLRSQLEDTSKARSEWPAEVKQHQESAERLNREAELLDRQGKSKQAEEKREEADLESGTARGLEQALAKVGDREATINARIEAVQKQVESHRAGAANRKQQQEQLEVTADKLDDVARTMGDAYRARLDADDLKVRAAQAADPAAKAQLEQEALAAETRSNQLFQQARRMVPIDDVARKALEDAGVVDGSAVPSPPVTSPPVGATPEVVGDEEDPTTDGRDATGDAEQDAGTEAESGESGSPEAGSPEAGSPEAGSPEVNTGDVVGDEEPGEEGASTAAQESGAGEVEGSEAGVDSQSPEGAPPADDDAAFAAAGESHDEMDGSGQPAAVPDAEIYSEPETTFDEQSVAAAPASPAPEQEFEATPDDEYVG